MEHGVNSETTVSRHIKLIQPPIAYLVSEVSGRLAENGLSVIVRAKTAASDTESKWANYARARANAHAP